MTGTQTLEATDDNPQQVAAYLLKEHGTEGAYSAALRGALEAQEVGDNYRLSVWREVKLILSCI